MKKDKQNFKLMNTVKRKTSGITLIALVVTIVVLLILAAVSISMLGGENGILTQAQRAKEDTEKANVIEQVQTDIMGKQAEEGTANLDRTDLKVILDTYFEGVPNDFTLDTILQTRKDEYGDYQIPLSDIFKGEIIDKPIIAADIKENAKIFYGSYVTNYECANNDAIETEEGIPGKWMIFYADNNNIYLIASDYINIDYCPSKDGATVTKGSTKEAGFTSIYSKYKGSADIASEYQWLNNIYFETLNGATATNINIRSVAYMLDADIWNNFAGDDAECAIGGPSVELLFKSYNEKYSDTNYPDGKYQARASNERGYQISTDGGSLWENYISSSSKRLKTSDSTYVIGDSSKAYGMWLASPSAFYMNGANYVMSVNHYGTVNYNRYNSTENGFRPLVCLKSDVKLKKTGENTYEIIK